VEVEIKLYTVDEVAKICRVRPRTIYNDLINGKLPGVKIGKAWRITRESLAAYVGQTTRRKK